MSSTISALTRGPLRGGAACPRRFASRALAPASSWHLQPRPHGVEAEAASSSTSSHAIRPHAPRSRNLQSPALASCALEEDSLRGASRWPHHRCGAGAARWDAATALAAEATAKGRAAPVVDLRKGSGGGTERSGTAAAAGSTSSRPQQNSLGIRTSAGPEERRTSGNSSSSSSNTSSGASGAGGGGGGDDNDGDGGSYLVNYGTAVRVLREDIPQVLQRPLQWHIYRSDVAFLNPWLPALHGLQQYRRLHSLMRVLSRVLYRSVTVEVQRMWSPPMAGGGGVGGGGGGGSSSTRPSGEANGRSGGRIGGGEGAGGTGSSNNSGSSGGGGQLRVQWRARAQPWLPWDEEQWLEVVATYRFDSNGIIAVHELTNVIPPEPPLLLWPLQLVARMLGRVQQPAGQQGGAIPGAGAVSGQGSAGGNSSGGGGGGSDSGGGGLVM